MMVRKLVGKVGQLVRGTGTTAKRAEQAQREQLRIQRAMNGLRLPL
jgi:hypothetical protein